MASTMLIATVLVRVHLLYPDIEQPATIVLRTTERRPTGVRRIVANNECSAGDMSCE